MDITVGDTSSGKLSLVNVFGNKVTTYWSLITIKIESNRDTWLRKLGGKFQVPTGE